MIDARPGDFEAFVLIAGQSCGHASLGRVPAEAPERESSPLRETAGFGRRTSAATLCPAYLLQRFVRGKSAFGASDSPGPEISAPADVARLPRTALGAEPL